MRSKHYICLLLLFLCTFAQAQTKKTLEDKRKKILDDIKNTQKLLNQTKATKEESLSELSTLEKQIELRESLITNTEGEVMIYDKQITKKAKTIESLSDDLSMLKKEYAETIYKSYRFFRVKDQLLFLASSKSFGDAFRKFNYLRKYAAFRKTQAESIKMAKITIARNIQEIDNKKKGKEKLLTEQSQQKQILDKEKGKKQQLVEQLKTKEKDLAATLKKKQDEANKLNAQIEDVIKKEIALAKQKELDKQKELAKQKELEKQNANKPISSNNSNTEKPVTNNKTNVNTPVKPITTTPEEKTIASSFYLNKGKLPWPVEKGVIVKGFGTYSHPELKNVTFENNGIDIKTESNSSVRCVYEGKVVGIISNPVYKTAVIISHGDYFTVYSKLSSVFVSKGETVKTKQSIGTAFNDENGNTEVHFEVWKSETKLNPSEWIVKR
ncbi:MAG: peptidoglycan DD-metalloendopeptidase family protein [Chitinophagales bacterium]|nr:peptidoglycan DD-metalloendopeptidase family protein [Chitinophagales bacterium]